MKKLILILSMFVFCAKAQADIFDKNTSNQGKISTAVSKEKDSYYYQSSGLDFNVPANTTVAQVSAKTNLNLGCSGFDFNASFLKQFSTEALKNDVVSQGQQLLAAAPLLILDYASPTLADLVKHFSALANAKIGLDVMSCQDIEKAVDDKFDKMRKESEKECLNENNGMGISAAMTYCKQQTDPFSYLKDVKGVPLSSGGQINIVKDALHRLGVSDNDSSKTLSITGDTQITKGGYQDIGQVAAYQTLVQQNKDQNMTDFLQLLVNYRNSKVVSDSDLDKFSRPGIQINQSVLDNILQLPDKQRTLAISKLSSYLAYVDANESYRSAIDSLNAAIGDPNTPETQKTVLRDKRDRAEYELTKAKEHYDDLLNLKEAIAGITRDADVARANLINNMDGTQRIGQDENDQAQKRGFLNNL